MAPFTSLTSSLTYTFCFLSTCLPLTASTISFILDVQATAMAEYIGKEKSVMFTERDIAHLVNKALQQVQKSEDEPLTKEHLAEAITKSISSCLLSHEFIDYVDEALAKKIHQSKRTR